jgi:triacylglycerol lipase
LFVVLAAALVVYILVRRRRRRRRRLRRRLAPRLPIVLAHGLLGFDEMGVWPLRAHYFRQIPTRLGEVGCEVHRARVARSASIARRAQELAVCVGAMPAKHVTIIAHSMGGLDARYAISRLGIGNKVAALITIGTPHWGTPIADVGTRLLDHGLGAKKLLALVGVDTEAFHDLTSVRMAAFNRDVQDVRGVVYACVVGTAKSKLRLNPLLLPSYLYLLEHAGPNDGLVPASSQRWGEVFAEIEADHWAQIGWGRFAAPDFYEGLARELVGRGF